MYPDLPYPGYSWSMNQHMGILNKENFYQLVWAAVTFGKMRDPSTLINQYFAAHDLFTPNIRSDSGQVDTWRDYQQVVSELGLIYSTRILRNITATPLGLAFAENAINVEEVITLQALRYQFPNGHKTTVSKSLRNKLSDTQFSEISTLTELQNRTGVQIRPAVLIWRVLRELEVKGAQPMLTRNEALNYVLPCIVHENTSLAVNAVIENRRTDDVLRRNDVPVRQMQEWFRFLRMTPLFAVTGSGVNATIRISDFGNECAPDIDGICRYLEKPETFWAPDFASEKSSLSWFNHFGNIDLSISFISTEYLNDKETIFLERDEPQILYPTLQNVDLRPFNPENFSPEQTKTNQKDETEDLIVSSYNASLSSDKKILHNHMAALIAEVCSRNGGQVFDDPKSVDLLVKFESYEYIIEVKSLSARNFVQRIRLALGQLCHYNYLRSLHSNLPQRNVIAIAAYVPPDSWCVPFLTNFMRFDLLSLENGRINLHTDFELSRRLFWDEGSQLPLFT